MQVPHLSICGGRKGSFVASTSDPMIRWALEAEQETRNCRHPNLRVCFAQRVLIHV